MELEELGRAINAMATRLRVHEAELRVSERSGLVGQLGAGVAHQVRNSATGARLAVQLHAKALGNPMPEDLAVAIRQLDLIEIQARQLLELGRPSARSKTLVNPTALADDVASMVGPRCRHSGITLEWRHPRESSPPILADAESLRMALLNLVTNAVEAAGPRGEVRVSLAGHADGSIEFTIQDNGPGPAPHLVDRLFEPFATGKREGIGLGLAVARRVAREHGGDVSWRRDGAITTFTLTTGKAENP
jgi:signal transduction histidine kinase